MKGHKNFIFVNVQLHWVYFKNLLFFKIEKKQENFNLRKIRLSNHKAHFFEFGLKNNYPPNVWTIFSLCQ